MDKRAIKRTVIFDAQREYTFASKTKSSSPKPPNRKRKLDNNANNNSSAKKRKFIASRNETDITIKNGAIFKSEAVSKTENKQDKECHATDEVNNSSSKAYMEFKSVDKVEVAEVEDPESFGSKTKETKKNQQTGPNNSPTHIPIKKTSFSDGASDDPLPLHTMEDKNKDFERYYKRFYGALKELQSTECEINGKKVTLAQLCEEWRILSMSSFQMSLTHLPWVDKKLFLTDAIDFLIDREIIPQLAKTIVEFDPIANQNTFAELRKIIADGLTTTPAFKKTLNKIFPNLANWGQKLTKSPNASEQDFMVLLYAKLFDPFFQHLPSARCSIMPLPPPFENFKRVPDMRAFVVKNGVEFTYLIRLAGREDTSEKIHRIAQLMRCALQRQILHLPSKESRSLYCFGILTSGYKIRLLQMHVCLFENDKSYESPIYRLWAEDELDLSNFDERSIARSLRWLTAIYMYHLALERSLDVSQQKDDRNNNQMKGHVTRSSPLNPLQKQGSQGTHEEVDHETLNAIISGINNNEAVVLQENVKYKKRVLAVCTIVNRMRMFVVKIYGTECINMNEVDILRVLGYHPNICQILAVAKLESGEMLVVQPWYENYDCWYEEQDKFPLVFLQLAKGLSHMHERGVIHGDIKPGNFLVDLEGNTRIIDFDFCTRIENANKLGGTDGYYAPEWYKKYLKQTGKGPLTLKIDIWSLAITMCQYAGVDFDEMVDPLERRTKILENIKMTTFLLWPVRDLVERMLSIRPNDRPTASDVFDELVRVYGDRGIAANEKTHQVITPIKQQRGPKRQEAVNKSLPITFNCHYEHDDVKIEIQECTKRVDGKCQ